MADQSRVVELLVQSVISETSKLMNSVEELTNIQDWRSKASVDFSDSAYDSIYTKEVYKHLDGSYINKVAGVVVPDLITYLKATTISGGPLNGKTYWEALQSTRDS